MSDLPKSAYKVQNKLNELGIDSNVILMDGSTRTATEAAKQVGCDVAQIVKTLVFKSETSKPIIILMSGSNHVDLDKAIEIVEQGLSKPDADFVKESTGYSIGGVSPVGLPESIEVLVDEDLFKHKELWAAAGHPQAVFNLTPQQLIDLSMGEVHDLKETRIA